MIAMTGVSHQTLNDECLMRNTCHCDHLVFLVWLPRHGEQLRRFHAAHIKNNSITVSLSFTMPLIVAFIFMLSNAHPGKTYMRITVVTDVFKWVEVECVLKCPGSIATSCYFISLLYSRLSVEEKPLVIFRIYCYSLLFQLGRVMKIMQTLAWGNRWMELLKKTCWIMVRIKNIFSI